MDDLQKIFQNHFESQFAPLKKTQKARKLRPKSPEPVEIEEEPEWEGIESSEDEVEIVEAVSTAITTERDPGEAKAFMSSKPPSTAIKVVKKAQEPVDAEEADNIKKDLALQRLLSESHLLSGDPGSLSHTGRNRVKATDLRLQSLGAKSVLVQKKMPLAHRKGIVAKAAQRDEKRRYEARENGIILERKTASKKRVVRKPGIEIDRPAVGKLRRGLLHIGERDLREIRGAGTGPARNRKR